MRSKSALGEVREPRATIQLRLPGAPLTLRFNLSHCSEGEIEYIAVVYD